VYTQPVPFESGFAVRTRPAMQRVVGKRLRKLVVKRVFGHPVSHVFQQHTGASRLLNVLAAIMAFFHFGECRANQFF
jgi:hypothetical protein